MGVNHLASEISPLLELELKAIEKTAAVLYEKLLRSESPSSYYNSLMDTVYGYELESRIVSPVGKEKLKILDVGFGCGESSLFLGSLGHNVHALEPSPVHCNVLAQAADKFNISIHVYEGIAEDIHRISEAQFDLCIFNSSLHHCDDPIRALSNCLIKLKPNGKVIAVNEPLLKFYRTKNWYARKLRENPISMGHYGGNEHIYSYNEYINLFKKAGFQSAKGFHHIRHKFPRETLRYDIDKKILGEYIHSERKLLLKYVLLLFLKKALKKERGLISGIFKHLSLVPISFEGSKNPEKR